MSIVVCIGTLRNVNGTKRWGGWVRVDRPGLAPPSSICQPVCYLTSLQAGQLFDFILFSFGGVWVIAVVCKPLLQDSDCLSREAGTSLAPSALFHGLHGPSSFSDGAFADLLVLSDSRKGADEASWDLGVDETAFSIEGYATGTSRHHGSSGGQEAIETHP